MYGSNYGYRSGLNPSMVEHLSELASDATARTPLRPGDLVLDIGSNDGTLLRKLASPGVTLTGMDPSADKFRQFYPAEAAAICDLFSAGRFQREYGSRKAKIVTSIAMFYDMESPLQFMREVAEVLADDGIWVFEQSYLPAMIESDSFDTICHEHLEYYALAQIQFMTDRSGLKILDVSFDKTNGGSFRVTTAHANGNSAGGDKASAILRREEAGGYREAAVYSQFRDRVRRHKEEIPRYLREAKRQGQKVFGYGASTKGNVVLQYCGITSEEIPFIADVNPDKFGCFTPKSLIPIISEEEAKAQQPDAFFVFPWHFREFIVAKERNFLARGGRLIFALPVLEAVDATPDSEGATE